MILVSGEGLLHACISSNYVDKTGSSMALKPAVSSSLLLEMLVQHLAVQREVSAVASAVMEEDCGGLAIPTSTSS